MKNYIFILVFTSFVFASNCSCFCCNRTAPKSQSAYVPLIYKEHYPIETYSNQPLIYSDKPKVKLELSKSTHITETSDNVETVTEYDECVKTCKIENHSMSVIEFCIRDKCEKLK